MITKIFLVIELLLRIFGVWDKFDEYMQARRIAEAEKRAQGRDDALKQGAAAQTPTDAWAAQEGVVKNEP